MDLKSEPLILITPCLQDLLGDAIPTRLIGSGTQGEVYELFTSGEHLFTKNRILKRTGYNEEYTRSLVFRKRGSGVIDEVNEVTLGIIAGQLGIGPIVHSAKICPDAKTGEDKVFLITDQLSGPSLKEKYPPTAEDLTSALNLIDVLYKYGIDHGDLTSSNIMYDGDQLYLIDYGAARPVHLSPAKLARQMMKQTGLLIRELTTEAQGNSGWSSATNLERATIFLTLVAAGQHWLKQRYPQVTLRDFGTSLYGLNIRVDEFGEITNWVVQQFFELTSE